MVEKQARTTTEVVFLQRSRVYVRRAGIGSFHKDTSLVMGIQAPDVVEGSRGDEILHIGTVHGLSFYFSAAKGLR